MHVIQSLLIAWCSLFGAPSLCVLDIVARLVLTSNQSLVGLCSHTYSAPSVPFRHHHFAGAYSSPLPSLMHHGGTSKLGTPVLRAKAFLAPSPSAAAADDSWEYFDCLQTGPTIRLLGGEELPRLLECVRESEGDFSAAWLAGLRVVFAEVCEEGRLLAVSVTTLSHQDLWGILCLKDCRGGCDSSGRGRVGGNFAAAVGGKREVDNIAEGQSGAGYESTRSPPTMMGLRLSFRRSGAGAVIIVRMTLEQNRVWFGRRDSNTMQTTAASVSACL